jgi:hypothetical protein
MKPLLQLFLILCKMYVINKDDQVLVTFVKRVAHRKPGFPTVSYNIWKSSIGITLTTKCTEPGDYEFIAGDEKILKRYK